MNLSKEKLLIFFATIAVLLWLLYPREIFLAFIQEGQNDWIAAESRYLNYLKDSPNNRFVSLRLVKLYEQSSQPQKAISLLKNLVLRRKQDWKLGESYLNIIKTNGIEAEYLDATMALARLYRYEKHVPEKVKTKFCQNALDWTKWHQKYPQAQEALLCLAEINGWTQDLIQEQQLLDRNLLSLEERLKKWQINLSQKPQDAELRHLFIFSLLAQNQVAQVPPLIRQGLNFEKDPVQRDLDLELLTQVYLKLDQPRFALDILTERLQNNQSELKRKLLENDKLQILIDLKEFKTLETYYLSKIQTTSRQPEDFKGLIEIYHSQQKFVAQLNLMDLYINEFKTDHQMPKMRAHLLLYDLKNLARWQDILTSIDAKSDFFTAKDLIYALESTNNLTALNSCLMHFKKIWPASIEIQQLEFNLALKQNDFSHAIHLARLMQDIDRQIVVANLLLSTKNPSDGVSLLTGLLTEISTPPSTQLKIHSELALFYHSAQQAKLFNWHIKKLYSLTGNKCPPQINDAIYKEENSKAVLPDDLILTWSVFAYGGDNNCLANLFHAVEGVQVQNVLATLHLIDHALRLQKWLPLVPKWIKNIQSELNQKELQILLARLDLVNQRFESAQNRLEPYKDDSVVAPILFLTYTNNGLYHKAKKLSQLGPALSTKKDYFEYFSQIKPQLKWESVLSTPSKYLSVNQSLQGVFPLPKHLKAHWQTSGPFFIHANQDNLNSFQHDVALSWQNNILGIIKPELLVPLNALHQIGTRLSWQKQSPLGFQNLIKLAWQEPVYETYESLLFKEETSFVSWSITKSLNEKFNFSPQISWKKYYLNNSASLQTLAFDTHLNYQLPRGFFTALSAHYHQGRSIYQFADFVPRLINQNVIYAYWGYAKQWAFGSAKIQLYTGEDFTRNLHALQTDIFGAQTDWSYLIKKNLKLEWSYLFGREGLLQSGTPYHECRLSLQLF